MDRQQRSNEYQQKKVKEQKYKVQKQTLNQDQNNFVKQIYQMSIQKLQQFLQKGYEKTTNKNQKLQFKINNAISKRLTQFPDELLKKQKQKIVKALQRHGCKVKEQQTGLFFAKGMIQGVFNPDLQNFTWVFQNVDNDKRLVKLIFQNKKHNAHYVKIRTDYPQIKTISLHKRLIKQANQILEDLVLYKKNTQIIEKN